MRQPLIGWHWGAKHGARSAPLEPSRIIRIVMRSSAPLAVKCHKDEISHALKARLMQRMQSKNLFLPETMTEQCSVSDSISRLNSSLSFDPLSLRGNTKHPALPPIREGQMQTSSGDLDVHTEESVSENDGAGLARRFSLPSINSFDYPASSSRKFSLPEAPVPHQPNLHVCKFPGCNWSFKRGEHLKRHMAVHTRERPFPCSFPGCQRSFSRIDNLNVHFRTHSDCFAASTSPTHSRQSYPIENVKMETPTRDFMPPVIPSRPPIRRYSDYDFSGLESLAAAACSTMTPANILYRPPKEDDIKVIRTDLDEDGRPIKYYVCQFHNCNMKFKRSEHLTRHRLVHTMERPFTCNYPGCNKSFSRMDNLRQHFRIHSRPNPNPQPPHFLSITEPYPTSYSRKRRY